MQQLGGQTLNEGHIFQMGEAGQYLSSAGDDAEPELLTERHWP